MCELDTTLNENSLTCIKVFSTHLHPFEYKVRLVHTKKMYVILFIFSVITEGVMHL